MEKSILNIIEESLLSEAKSFILNENKDSKEVFHITCEGEPVDTYESEEVAMRHLDIYKKKHPEKEFIIEKTTYNSPSEMIDKLEEMGEEIENKENKPMKKNVVKGLGQAIFDAKSKGLKEIKFNGEVHNVDEIYKELEEEEGSCNECGQGYMEEDSDIEESNAFILAADKAKDDGEEEFEFPKGSGKMHKVTLSKNIDTNEGEMGSCNECGSSLNEEGMCSECGMGFSNESKKTTIKMTENEVVSLIKKIVSEAKKDVKEGGTGVSGVLVTKRAQTGSKKENDDYMKEVEKKLKDISTFDGNDNPEFPKQVGKGEKMAINATPEQEEYFDDNRGGTLADLNYDQEPSEGFKKRLKMALEGDSKMGNSQDAANVIPSKTGEKIAKTALRKKEKESKDSVISWGHSWKSPEKVVVVKESEKPKMSSIINEDIEKMKKIIGYNKKTQ
jgi:hypothetical protein